MKFFTVLITGIGTATSLSIIKGLRKQMDYKVKIIGVDSSAFVSGKYFVDKFYTVPLASEVENFQKKVIKIITEENVDLVIPIIDYELPLWSKLQDHPKLKSVRILLSNKSSLEICMDKYEIIKFFENIEIPTVKILDLKQIKNFPVFIKPRKFGRASIDAYKIENKEELNLLTRRLKGNFVLQEYIEGEECTADCLSDLEGDFIYCVVRRRIETKGGLSVKGEIINDHKAFDYCRKIINTLKIPGVCNIQFFKRKQNYYFFEINPRFAGTHAFTIEAGLNSPKYILDMLSGKKIDASIIKIKYGLKMVRFWDELIINGKEGYKPDLLKTCQFTPPKINEAEVLIFDFDGTLIHPLPLNWTKLKMEINDICREEQLNVEIFENLSDKLTSAFTYSKKLRNQILELVIYYEQNIIKQVRANIPVLNIFKKAIKEKKKIYILSNNTTELISYFLRSHKLSIEENNILSLNKNIIPKPSTAFFQEIEADCSDRAKIFYFGNSDNDEKISSLLGFRYFDVTRIN